MDYSTEEAHYDAIGAPLLHAPGQVAGDLWTDDLQEGWAEAYESVASLMKQGASQPV